MSSGKIPTIDELVTEIRDDLDEPVDTATNFWTDDYLIARLNRGFRQVWQQARETHENWFVRTLRSDGDPLTLYGRVYDPALMQVTADATTLVLPPDFYEALSFEALPSADQSIADVLFTWTRLSTEEFRAGIRVASDNSSIAYAIDVQWGDGGPTLALSPAAGSSITTVDTTLTYVYAPKDYAAGDALENSGFSRIMLDAAVAYAVLEARRKEGVATNITIAQSVWVDKISMVTRSSGPRQSQAPEVVEGYLEEWI
jgi:hypothetical protein